MNIHLKRIILTDTVDISLLFWERGVAVSPGEEADDDFAVDETTAVEELGFGRSQSRVRGKL